MTPSQPENEEDFTQSTARKLIIPFFGTLSQRGLDPIKLAYSPSQPHGRFY